MIFLGEISRGRVEVRDFLLPILVLNEGDIEVDFSHILTFNIAVFLSFN